MESHVRVLTRDELVVDWRAAEATSREAMVRMCDQALAELAEWETCLGERDEVGHYCRCLAASLRVVRSEDAGRAELLRTAAELLAPRDADELLRRREEA